MLLVDMMQLKLNVDMHLRAVTKQIVHMPGLKFTPDRKAQHRLL